MINGAIARIIVRYLAGTLFGVGASQIALNDPDIMSFLTMAVGGAISIATEFLYSMAKKRGWTT